MKVLMPYYFKEFECVGKDCTETCCSGWGIVVDPKSYEVYQKVEGEFGDKLRNSIKETEGDYFFELQEGMCPCLNEEKLCEIYIKVGKEAMCHTCQSYPRLSFRYGDLIERYLTLSCPEVARILISNSQPVDFIFEEEVGGEEVALDNPELFNVLLLARASSIESAQIRELALWKRFVIVTMMGEKIQQHLINEDVQGIRGVIDTYTSLDTLNNLNVELDRLPTNHFVKVTMVDTLINYMKEHVGISKTYAKHLDLLIAFFQEKEESEIAHELEALEKEFECFYQERGYELENFLVYYLFRYYMMAYNKKELMSDVAMMNFAYATVKIFAALKWKENGGELSVQEMADILASLSKTIEHSKQKYELVYEKMKECGFTQLAYQIVMVRDHL